MRLIYTLLFFVLTAYSGLAQTIYYDSEWNELPSKEDASFYREIEKRQDTFYVKDFYISGQLQMTGSYLDKKLKTKCGQFIYYYPNGQKMSEGTYNKDLKQDDWKYWSEVGEELKNFETMPEFPGGVDSMMTFLSENVKYPKDAIEKKKHGRVIVQFVVGTDGSIGQVEVIKSVYPSIDDEAKRVVLSMPKWKPGTQYGKPVFVKFTLPLSFKLN